MENRSWGRRFGEVFRLDTDVDREGTTTTIRESVAFRGTNLWALILAILVASIGLNVNSTAVIIGAMLISPLMGPITGAGLALGIYDVGLLRRSLANLALMTVISLGVSTAYFWISPLGATTSELLARTTPTFYDVLIALLGGSALMVGVSRKNRSSNILAGVAIATALMPPLCTAGYGLASHNVSIFAGAFYLYLINSVFIGLATYLFSKALKLRVFTQNQDNERRIKRLHVALTAVAIVVFITPSIFVAYDVVRESTWRANLANYQKANFTFPESQVLNTQVTGQGNHRVLEVALAGAPLSQDLRDHLNQLLPQYGLDGLSLRFVQGTTEAPSPKSSVESLVPQVTWHGATS